MLGPATHRRHGPKTEPICLHLAGTSAGIKSSSQHPAFNLHVGHHRGEAMSHVQRGRGHESNRKIAAGYLEDGSALYNMMKIAL